jgi:hypothetical protein
MNIEQVAQKLLEHVQSLIVKSEAEVAHYKGAVDGITTLVRLVQEEAAKDADNSNKLDSSQES